MIKEYKGIRILVLTGFCFYFAYVPVSSLYPLMSMDFFGKTASGAAIVETAFALCMLIGGLLLGIGAV